jgi:hypothetical protein
MLKFALSLSAFATEAYAIGRTYADCLKVAALFDNTCDVTANTPITFSSHTGATMSCTGTMRCPSGSTKATFTAASPCTYQRKLCVTCS